MLATHLWGAYRTRCICPQWCVLWRFLRTAYENSAGKATSEDGDGYLWVEELRHLQIPKPSFGSIRAKQRTQGRSRPDAALQHPLQTVRHVREDALADPPNEEGPAVVQRPRLAHDRQPVRASWNCSGGRTEVERYQLR